ncbi:phospholipase D-like domain-containing protein [Halobacteriovorax sp. RT-2-6]|uniref:phospholipase D-like domain-containing protein n=1 Tax=unclassified Halobacteriovorax TaxID=2639665 RepID=UPI00399BF836
MIHYCDLNIQVREELSKAKESICIFSPYMKISALRDITANLGDNVKKTFIVSFDVGSFCRNAIDLEVLEQFKEKNTYVYINNRLHMKAYLKDFESGLIGSANCTKRGLGLCSNANYEVLSHLNEMSESFKCYCDFIISRSVLVDKSLFDRISEKVKELDIEKISNQEIDIIQCLIQDEFDSSEGVFASQLPRSNSFSEVVECILNNNEKSFNIESDALAFSILENRDLTYEQVKKHAAEVFFSLPFSRYLLNSFNESVNFGKIRKELERLCLDNPRPNRDEINVLINNYLNWLEELADEKLYIKQFRHTKAIFKNGVADE